MVDFIRIVNDAKVALVEENERLEEKEHLERLDLDRRDEIDAQLRILNQVHAEMLRQENLALDALYLAHRERGVAT
jgi:hypothetical protein